MGEGGNSANHPGGRGRGVPQSHSGIVSEGGLLLPVESARSREEEGKRMLFKIALKEREHMGSQPAIATLGKLTIFSQTRV